ncbi:hypothetical protein VTN31DRAFT_1749 [Thermomyces dupontii]|uniref:uncharacterized protein n=1 Tax=Talaromyces thermophilus TaxID=28565 RepID=UPI003742D6D0
MRLRIPSVISQSAAEEPGSGFDPVTVAARSGSAILSAKLVVTVVFRWYSWGDLHASNGCLLITCWIVEHSNLSQIHICREMHRVTTNRRKALGPLRYLFTRSAYFLRTYSVTTEYIPTLYSYSVVCTLKIVLFTDRRVNDLMVLRTEYSYCVRVFTPKRPNTHQPLELARRTRNLSIKSMHQR